MSIERKVGQNSGINNKRQYIQEFEMWRRKQEHARSKAGIEDGNSA